MAKIQKKMVVPYTPEQMYALVADVERYPDFIGPCVSGQILRQSNDGLDVDAQLDFRKGKFSQSFATRNTHTPNIKIEMNYLKGPFKHLRGSWTFESDEVGCLVGIDMDFEFSNRMLQMMFSGAFQQLMADLLSAFSQRAKELYG